MSEHNRVFGPRQAGYPPGAFPMDMLRHLSLLSLAAASLLLAPGARALAQTGPGNRPSTNLDWDEVERITAATLQIDKHYRPGYLLSRSQVEQVLRALQQRGWSVPDAKLLVRETLPQGDYLVRRLNTPNGRKLMQKIAGDPLGYDRLDRLCRMAQGHAMIDMLVDSPGGYQLIDYLTTSPLGLATGRTLEDAPGGKDFNKPTGRIYTETDLLRRLRKSFVAS